MIEIQSERVIVPMSPDLVRRLDMERRQAEGEKIPSRAELIRQLLEEAMAARQEKRGEK